MRTHLLVGAALVLTIAAPLELPAATAPAATLSSDQRLALDMFRELIELNTTHQFGSTIAADAVAARLKAGGFSAADVQVIGPSATKGNLVARLRGRGPREPVLFLAHLDVVEARKEDWSEELDPFKLTERDGYFYGRGTLDVKQEAAIFVANLIRLKREGFVPDRDFIVALTADEEAGGDANGVEWLLANRRDLINAEYCINADAGGGQIENGRRVRYTVQTSEKMYLELELEVTNIGGHSSLPVKDNAIYHLADGLTRLARFDFPAKVNETTREFFERTAKQETGQVAADMRAVAQPNPDPTAVARLSALQPAYNGLMRNTCVATMVEAGHAPNALPQRARATINCRLLPGESPENVRQTLKTVLADDQITIKAMNEVVVSEVSPLLPEVMQPIERIVTNLWPGVPVIPVMDPWSSDGGLLRQAGIPVYGVPGVFYEIDPVRSHGKDERIEVKAFYEGLEFTYELMKALGSRR